MYIFTGTCEQFVLDMINHAGFKVGIHHVKPCRQHINVSSHFSISYNISFSQEKKPYTKNIKRSSDLPRAHINTYLFLSNLISLLFCMNYGTIRSKQFLLVFFVLSSEFSCCVAFIWYTWLYAGLRL